VTAFDVFMRHLLCKITLSQRNKYVKHFFEIFFEFLIRETKKH